MNAQNVIRNVQMESVYQVGKHVVRACYEIYSFLRKSL